MALSAVADMTCSCIGRESTLLSRNIFDKAVLSMYPINLPYIAGDGRVSPPASPRFSYKSDRLKPLRAFCQTVRLGSVSRAAEALFVSQPAITLQLQALERDLGTPLLERSGRRLLPTREGELLYEMALPLVEQLDGLENAFRERV